MQGRRFARDSNGRYQVDVRHAVYKHYQKLYLSLTNNVPEWTVHGVKALFPREATQVYQPTLRVAVGGGRKVSFGVDGAKF